MENTTQPVGSKAGTKFCSHCGGKIPEAAVVCTLCGCQVGQVRQAEQPNIIINNANNNTNMNMVGGHYARAKNKWVAFWLCFFLGFLGAHKFYEERTGMGVVYLFTVGLFGIGWFVDTITLLFKPNPYYV